MSTHVATKSEDFVFEGFSDEIILKVLSYLDLDDRFNCYFTSKRLRAICQDHTLPSMWQTIHVFNPNLLFETSKNPMNKVFKDLEEIRQDKYLQQNISTWKNAHLYNLCPCESSQNLCGKMNNNLEQKNKSYLNLNIENFNNESIQEILDKGCKYLIMSNIFPRVGCEMLSRICKEKEFLQLKEIKFTWCLLHETGEESNQHIHPCISLIKDGYETSILD